MQLVSGEVRRLLCTDKVIRLTKSPFANEADTVIDARTKPSRPSHKLCGIILLRFVFFFLIFYRFALCSHSTNAKLRCAQLLIYIRLIILFYFIISWLFATLLLFPFTARTLAHIRIFRSNNDCDACGLCNWLFR